MNRETLLNLCQEIVGEENSEDIELISKLIKTVITTAEAEQIVAFLPIALVRIVIAKIASVHFFDSNKLKERGELFNLDDLSVNRLDKEIARESYVTGSVGNE